MQHPLRVPLGRQRGFPLVQVMSNSQDQSKDVLRIANAMWSAAAREFVAADKPGKLPEHKGNKSRKAALYGKD